MNGLEFDSQGLFDEDYLYFFGDALEERADSDTDLIWRLLGLEPGMEVLDLACGHGRITNRLAARGCQVTGLDATQLFLDVAERDARDRRVTVDYVRGDMRDLPWQGRFDRVVNWFTAFGYFDDDGNKGVLAQAAAALRPGGLMAIEMNNHDALMRRFEPASVTEKDGNLVVDQHRLDPLTGRNVVTRTVIRDGQVRRVPYFVRMFRFPELAGWLREAGFAEVAGYGEDGQPLSADSRRMITVARR